MVLVFIRILATIALFLIDLSSSDPTEEKFPSQKLYERLKRCSEPSNSADETCVPLRDDEIKEISKDQLYITDPIEDDVEQIREKLTEYIIIEEESYIKIEKRSIPSISGSSLSQRGRYPT